jgi:hypothetical protein
MLMQDSWDVGVQIFSNELKVILFLLLVKGKPPDSKSKSREGQFVPILANLVLDASHLKINYQK